LYNNEASTLYLQNVEIYMQNKCFQTHNYVVFILHTAYNFDGHEIKICCLSLVHATSRIQTSTSLALQSLLDNKA